LCIQDEKDPATEMADAFEMFDKDGTGKITFKNMQDVCRQMGDGALADNEPEVQQIIDEVTLALCISEHLIKLHVCWLGCGL
jgi:Ca2+-binding EF-hand superfamily protein